jgi:hypothetical protein
VNEQGKVSTGGQGETKEGRDEAGGDPHDNVEGTTRGEPQHEHRWLKDGKYRVVEREELERGENEVHEPGELEHQPREGEDHGIRERDNGTTHPAPSPTANTAVKPALHERTRFDWATNDDESISPVPISSNFHSTKPPSPLVSPNPAPCLSYSPTTPPQPGRTPLQPICARTSTMGAPSNRTLAAYTPAAPIHSVHTSTAPVDPVPVSTTNRHAPITASPQVSAERTPTAIVHGPCDLSALRSDAPNPWVSLCRCHYSRSSHTPCRFTCRRQYPPTYPVNSYLPTTPIPKPTAPTSFHVFETVRHLHGIGPNKPVIRVPARTEMAKSTYPALSDQDIAKSTPPSHPAAPIQCHCGQLVPVSSNQMFCSIPSHRTLSSFIS